VIDRRRRSPRRNFNLPNGAGEKTEIEWLSADAPGDDGRAKRFTACAPFYTFLYIYFIII